MPWLPVTTHTLPRNAPYAAGRLLALLRFGCICTIAWHATDGLGGTRRRTPAPLAWHAAALVAARTRSSREARARRECPG